MRIFGEVNDGDDDVVFHHPLRCQARRHRIIMAKGPGHDRWPALQADADELSDAHFDAGSQLVEHRLQFGPNRLGDIRGHAFGTPRISAMRPVRANSTMPIGRIRSMNASILLSWPETSTIMVSALISTTRARNISTSNAISARRSDGAFTLISIKSRST